MKPTKADPAALLAVLLVMVVIGGFTLLAGLIADQDVRIAYREAPTAVPRCEEDEYLAPRPFPQGPLVCIHADDIKADRE